ncbi:MAG: cobalt ECF transporter T component CbiQ [Chloroflexi bacterium]|nr:cobalt ECF transporter T component CbiQ [Chloroflexota bacterium]
MTHKGEIFSDVFAQKDNFVTRIEARVKMGFTAIALVINLLSPTIYASVGIAAFCFALLLAVKAPPRLLLLRMAMPLVMAAVVLVTQVFFYGVTPLFAIPVWGWRLAGYEEGLARGVLIMGRVIAGVALILFLSMSTPVSKLLLAAKWFRVPQTFIGLALLVYRYIFVLIEEAAAIKDAQKVRLGYRDWHQSMRSLGVLGGSLFFRAYDRADRVFEAMLARGYSGGMAVRCQVRWGGRDFAAAFGLGAMLAVFYLMGQLRW